LKGGGLLARGVEWLVGGLDCTLTLDIPLPSSLLYDDFALTVRVKTQANMGAVDFEFEEQIIMVRQLYYMKSIYFIRESHDRDHCMYMVVGFTTTYTISAYYH
jgi:hypothetical protein